MRLLAAAICQEPLQRKIRWPCQCLSNFYSLRKYLIFPKTMSFCFPLSIALISSLTFSFLSSRSLISSYNLQFLGQLLSTRLFFFPLSFFLLSFSSCSFARLRPYAHEDLKLWSSPKVRQFFFLFISKQLFIRSFCIIKQIVPGDLINCATRQARQARTVWITFGVMYNVTLGLRSTLFEQSFLEPQLYHIVALYMVRVRRL